MTAVAPCVHGFMFSGPAPCPKPGSACERPATLTCTRCSLVVVVDCHSTRSLTCGPCGADYKDRVRRLATVPSGGLLLITVTAPGKRRHKRPLGGVAVRKLGPDGKRHTVHEGATWVDCDCASGVVRADVRAHERHVRSMLPRWGTAKNGAARASVLPRAASLVDPRPLELDGSMGDWNSTLGGPDGRWNRLVNKGIRRDPALAWAAGAYFVAREGQKRGALHLHMLVRVPAGTEVTSAMVALLGRVAESYGFGHVLDVEAVEGRRAAGYVAKYVAKGSNNRPDVPWMRTHEVFGRIGGHATYRAWSCSRSWPGSMRRLLADRAHFAELMTRLPSWEGRGSVVWPGDGWFVALPTRRDWEPPPGLRLDVATGELFAA